MQDMFETGNFTVDKINCPVSKHADGWCGEPCPGCKGSGQVDTDHSYAACGRCGGTGERYEPRLEMRT